MLIKMKSSGILSAIYKMSLKTFHKYKTSKVNNSEQFMYNFP